MNERRERCRLFVQIKFLIALIPTASPPARLQRGLHLPPLLPQSHHLPQRDDRRDGLQVEERQGESLPHPSLPPSQPGFASRPASAAVWEGLSRLVPLLPLCVQPLIDCAVCYKTLRDQIEPEPRPYVHCVHRTALTQVQPRLLKTPFDAQRNGNPRLRWILF